MNRIRHRAAATSARWTPVLAALLASMGCAEKRPVVSQLAVRDAIQTYQTANADELQSGNPAVAVALRGRPGPSDPTHAPAAASALFDNSSPAASYFTLGMVPRTAPETQATTAPSGAEAGVPAGYWQDNLWDQMTHEFGQFGQRGFWRGFKTSFWDVENALLLTATMGASITIRETGVDGTIRDRVHHHRQLGDMDETVQILGHPATHFAGAGVLWLASAATKDAKQHEVAKALIQALAVNGVTTLGLKAATNTRAPNGKRHAWPSGHTSSAFAVAAVLNEYYGPWVGVPSLAVAGLVGYQRIDSRAHEFSDVVFGAMLGYVVGTSIARDEKAQFPELFGMQVVPFTDPETGAAGFALMKSW